MLHDRASLIRLTLIFGISAAFYALAAIVATNTRDHLLARAQMLHDLRQQVAGTEPAAAITAIPLAGL